MQLKKLFNPVVMTLENETEVRTMRILLTHYLERFPDSSPVQDWLDEFNELYENGPV